MSAPVLWIIFPGLAAMVLYLARRWKRLTTLVGILIALFLAWLAWQLPIGKTFSLGHASGLPPFNLNPAITVFGQRLVLDDPIRPVLVLIYLASAFWFAGATTAGTSRLFIPLGLGVAALWTASVAVEPSDYAVPMLIFAVLIVTPLLSSPGQEANRGILRFLTFQTLGLCLILFADRFMPLTVIDPNHPNAIPIGIIWLGLGFALLLAVFPFHTWIPMLAESVNPYVAAFVLYTFPTAILLLVLENLHSYVPLVLLPAVYTALQAAAILMVLTGGIWAAFERHLGRMLGFAAIFQIGISLLAVSLSGQVPASGGPAASGLASAGQAVLSPGPTRLVFLLIGSQCVGLAVWGQALCVLLSKARDLRFPSVQGLARSLPVATASLFLANLSLAGLPLLASFPTRLGLLSSLSQNSPRAALLMGLGTAGLFVAGFRTLAMLVSSPDRQAWRITERGAGLAVLLLGALLLFVVGLIPQ